MKESFWRCLLFTGVGVFVIVVITYIFNLLVFGYIPSDALFLEGLLALVLGIMVLVRLPHGAIVGGRRKILVGSALAKDVKSHIDSAGNTLAIGLALIIAAIMLFLLSLSKL